MTIKTEVPAPAIIAWTGEGEFKDRVIEFDEKAKFYQIYPKSGYPVFWNYFKYSPEEKNSDKVLLINNWVADCWSSLKFGEKKFQKLFVVFFIATKLL